MTTIMSSLLVKVLTVSLFVTLTLAEDPGACDELSVNASAILEDKMNLPLNVTDLLTYIDQCQSSGEVSVADLVRRTSEICTNLPIDAGSGDCDGVRANRYGYDKRRGQCIGFAFSGCGGNENNFQTLEECRLICEDPCSQPADAGASYEVHTTRDGRQQRVSCENSSGVYWAYNSSTNTCDRLEYLGCKGNKNRYETRDECLQICGRPTTVRPVQTSVESLSLSRIRRQSAMDQVDDTNLDEYCSEFERAYPEIPDLIAAADRTTSPDTLEMITQEIESQVADQTDSTTRQRVRRQLFSFFNRSLKHVTAKIINKNSCRRIEVTIRIKCLKALAHAPTDAEKNKLCGLVKQGIKKYWERDLALNGATYPVHITVRETWLLSKTVVLKYYREPLSYSMLERSFNPGLTWLPMWVKYRGYKSNLTVEDKVFAETAAHEYGHDILVAAAGLFWSWTHERTSTAFQEPYFGSPQVPSPPAEINLMWYYNGGDYTDYYNRVVASASQVRTLVNSATFRFNVWWCPGAIGSPCLTNKHCLPPGICSFFRCVTCNRDNQCASSNQYCKGLYNPFMINHCHPKRPNGQLCTRNAMCISDKCDGGQCVECKYDSDCPSNKWCKNKDFPLILNTCVYKLGNGGWCVRDAQCYSGKCDGFRCVECKEHHHCPSNQYCRWKDLPGVVNKCTNKKCKGWCGSDNSKCLSGVCKWHGFCKKC